MNSLKFIGIAIVIIFTIISCGEEKKQTIGTKIYNSSINSTIVEADEIVVAIHKGNLLNRSGEKDRDGIQKSIKNISTALLVLRQNNNSIQGLRILHQAINEFSSYQILKLDMPILNKFIINCKEILDKISRLQKVHLKDLSWALFSYDFSFGLSPLASFTTSTGWITDIKRDNSFAAVSSRDDTVAWLLSPIFDFRTIKNPKLKINHLFIINKSNRDDNFRRADIITTAFKVYVSTDYKKGDPNNTATWKELDISPLPTGHDFHQIDSPFIDLSDYIGENVTIGFKFNLDSLILGKHYLTWQVSKFEIYGAGDELKYKTHPKAIYQHVFNGNDLEPYKALKMKKRSNNWEPYRGSRANYAKVSAKNKEQSSWLFSPKLKISRIGLMLKINETVNFPVWEKMKIMISKNYDGGDPRLSDWDEIDHRPDRAIDPSAWTDLIFQGFSLDEYVGEEIVIAFLSEAGKQDSYKWEIASVEIYGIGEELDQEEFDISYKPIEERPVGFLSINFDNGAEGFSDDAVEGEKVRWFVRDHDGEYFYGIKSYFENESKPAKIFMTTSLIDLTKKKDVAISITHATHHYNNEAQQKKLMKIYILSEDIEKEELLFDKWPAGNSFIPIDSDWVKIPKQFQSKKVRIGFSFECYKPFFPLWNLHAINFKELKQESNE